MMKSGFKNLLIFLPLLGIALLLTLPLRLLVENITVPPELKLEGITGNVFSGQIDRLTIRKFPVHQVKYQFDFTCLLGLSICLDTEFLEGQLILSYNPLSKQLEIINGDLEIPFATPGLLPPTLFVKPSGSIILHDIRASTQSQIIQNVSTRAVWQNAGIEGEDVKLGDFEFNLNRTGPEYEITIRDLDAMITVNGNIIVNQKGNYISTATLSAKPGLPSSIKSALELVARKKGLNKFEINKSGKLPKKLLAHLSFD
jgi:general secretion pathway protein N